MAKSARKSKKLNPMGVQDLITRLSVIKTIGLEAIERANLLKLDADLNFDGDDASVMYCHEEKAIKVHKCPEIGHARSKAKK